VRLAEAILKRNLDTDLQMQVRKRSISGGRI
jgi:hypothetical protein